MGAVVNVPSLHLPVVPAGVPAGACAIRAQGRRIIPTTAVVKNPRFMPYPPSFNEIGPLTIEALMPNVNAVA